ncbi:MAG: hypothetical protein U0992_08945 [Planctomycetaceae bacterium]
MVMVYEGTEPSSLADWFNNAAQGFGYLGEGFQYTQAKADAAIAAQLATQAGMPLHFTGHSLGGGLAATAALVTHNTAVTFNAAGVNSVATNTLADAYYITNYRVKGEILSTLQDSQLGGGLMPNSSVGKTYWLTPEEDTGMVFRHTGSILPAMRELF